MITRNIAFSFLGSVFLLSGCCSLMAGKCCPSCPPPKIIRVENHCELPPDLQLPLVTSTEEGCPDDRICFDLRNAAALAYRETSLKGWVKEAKVRCLPPASQPTSLPVGKP